MCEYLPLQMTNTVGGTDCYRERVESQLAPCLAHFAVAAGKDSLWKPVNQQLLLKSKHSVSQVCTLDSLKCEKASKSTVSAIIMLLLYMHAQVFDHLLQSVAIII